MAEERKSISIVSFNDDTGSLQIKTMNLPAERTSALYKDFLDPSKSYHEPVWLPERTPGELIPFITIDTRSGNGIFNTVTELKGVTTRYDVREGSLTLSDPDYITTTPLNEEGIGHVKYSIHSGRETWRRLGSDRGNKGVSFNAYDGRRVKPFHSKISAAEWEKSPEGQQLGRPAPKVVAEDITRLLQAVSKHGRQIEGALSSWKTIPSLGLIAQQIYDVDSSGMKNGTNLFDPAHDKIRWPLNTVSNKPLHLKCMLVPTSQLARSFPFLQAIKPTGPKAADNDVGPSRPVIAWRGMAHTM